MVTIKYKGRLGNNLIQYAAGYILAKRTGLALDVNPSRKYRDPGNDVQIFTDFGSVFKIQPPTGNSHTNIIELNDSNYYKHLNNPKTDTGYELNGFFQDGRLLCDYRDEILDLYQYERNPVKNISKDDAFIACRFGDCLKLPLTYCSIEYIEGQLKNNRHNYQNIHLTSDSLDYPPLVELMEKYNITPYNNNPLDTILFAKNFNNLILSAGSFNYWMAYLSVAPNIIVYSNNRQDPLQRKNAWSYNKNIKFTK